MSNNAWIDVESRPDDIRRATPAPPDDQEGGIWAWLAVVGSFLVFFASFGVINSFGFFQKYYQQDFLSDYSPLAIAFIGSLQISLMYLVGPISGALADSYGPQYLYPVAAVCCCGSLLSLSFSKPNVIWQQFLAQGVLFGLSVGFGTRTASTVVAQYFKRRQALAMGFVAGGSSVGGVCFPIMLERLTSTIGFAWSLRVAALILTCCYAIALCITRPKFARKPLKSFADLLDFKGCLDIRYLTLAVGTCIASRGLYLPYYYAGRYASFFDPESTIQDYLLPLLNATSFFGRVIGGQIADKIGRLNFLYPMIELSGVVCLAMWLPAENLPTLIAFVCLYGFCSGIFISVTPVAVAQITPEEKLGARVGAFFSFTAVATLLGTPIGGALIRSETKEGYMPMIIFAGCTLIVGGSIIFFSRTLHDRNIGKKW